MSSSASESNITDNRPYSFTPYGIIIVASILCVIVIYSYGMLICKSNFDDPLITAYANPPWNAFLDGWGLSHFIFYATLTFFFPSLWWLIFLIGVAWEVIEYYMNSSDFTKCAKTRKIRQSKKNNKANNKANESKGTSTDYKWWYARWQDIVMNALGVLLGYTVAVFVLGGRYSWKEDS